MHLQRVIRAAALIAALPLLASCSLFPNPGGDADLVGTWQLTSVVEADGNVVTPGPDEVHRLHFRRGGQFGADSCNSCGGTYETGRGQTLTVVAACTEMACMGIDLGVLLAERMTYRVEGRHLTIHAMESAGQARVLHFARVG